MTALRRFGLVLALGVLTAIPALGQTANTPSGIFPISYTISAPQFEAEFPGMPNGFIPPGARRFGLIPNAPFLAEAHPRNGAFLMGAYLDACNDDASAIITMTITSTDILGNLPQLIGALTLPALAGCVSTYLDLVAAAYLVDDATKHLIIRVELGSGDPDTSFASVRLVWDQEGFFYSKVQIFGDVPEDNIFFAYIQAFADLNITGGCSALPLLFCPNNFVTRAQIATFFMRNRMLN
jgi:hypothetical protein